MTASLLKTTGGMGRTCVSCRYYTHDIMKNEFYRCARTTQQAGISIVTGQPYPAESVNPSSCFAQREDGWLGSLMSGTCGKGGRFWEFTL